MIQLNKHLLTIREILRGVRRISLRSQGFHITNRIQNKVDTLQLNKNWIGTQELQSAVDIQGRWYLRLALIGRQNFHTELIFQA